MGDGFANLGPKFVGVDPATSSALTAPRAAWGRHALEPAVAPAADGYARGSDDAVSTEVARRWLERVRAEFPPAPAGTVLPSMPASLGAAPVRCLSISPDGDILAGGDRGSGWLMRPPYADWRLVLGDRDNGGRPCFRPGHPEMVLPLGEWGLKLQSLDASGRATSSADAVLSKLWDELCRAWDKLGPNQDRPWVRQVASAANGDRVAATVEMIEACAVLTADLRTGETAWQILYPAFVRGLSDIAIDPTGRRIVLASQSGEILAWDGCASAGPVSLFRPPSPRAVRRMALDASGTEAAVLWEGGQLLRLDLETGVPRGPGRQWGDCTDIAYDPNDDALVALIASGQRMRVGAGQDDPEPISDVPDLPRAVSFEFSGSGEWYVTAHLDDSLRVWDAQDHKPWAGV